MSTNQCLIFICACWLLGCEPGPIGSEYGCGATLGGPTLGCMCLSGVESLPDEVETCGDECCFVRQLVRDNRTTYECSCDGAVGQYFDPPVSGCYQHPGWERVDACPPTRLITDEVLTFACFASDNQHNEMVIGDGGACAVSDATGGCLTRVSAEHATCVSLTAGDECIGIPVTACDENLAFHLTQTVFEAWNCSMDAQLRGEPTCLCSGPHSKEVVDGWYSPVWTYPCPPIPDQCCRYWTEVGQCQCETGDCADLPGIEVSACPPPAEEWASIEDG